MLRLTILAAITPAVVAAQARDTAPVLLPSVSVTATRAPLETRALPVTVTVFDRAAIRAAGITQLADVVRLLPGATVLSSGSYGSQTSLFFRGGESDYVQVLVDGVPMNEPGGFYNFGTLTLDNVDRVEVLRGPASVLYGSDAVSGVIQVFTKRDGGASRFTALAGGGSNNTKRYEVGLGGGNSLRGWSLGAASHNTDGILAFNNQYRNDILSASAHARGARADVSLSARFTDHTYHYPTNSAGVVEDRNAYNAEERAIGAIDAGWRATPWLELRARTAHRRGLPITRDQKDDVADQESLISDADVTRNVTELRAIATIAGGHALTVSAERARDREESSSTSESAFGTFDSELRATRTNTAYAAQLLGNAARRTTYMVGVRFDDNSEFGDFTTARAGAAYRVTRGWTIRASIANAFKAPTFFENFATGFTVGNPDLTPEQTRSYEAGAQYVSPRGRVSIGATAFVQRFSDLIQYFGAAPPGEPNYRNLAAALADGIELEGVARLVPRVTARASYTYLRTEVTDAGADTGPSATFVEGDRLLRRPTHFATLSLQTFTLRGASLTTTATYTGERDDRDFNQFPAAPIVMKGFTRVDVALTQPLTSGTRAQTALVVRIANVLDKSYQESFGYDAPRWTLFAGLRIGD